MLLVLVLISGAPALAQPARRQAPGFESPTGCVWDVATDQPQGRLEAPSLEIGGKLWIIGGFQYALVASDRVDVFDPQNGSWSSRANLPSKVTHSGFAFDGRFLWLVGGFVGNHPGPVVADVWKYDVETDTWSAGPPLPAPRGSGAAAIVGRQLHYFGGVLTDRKTDAGEHWWLDLDAPLNWQVAAPLPNPRNHLGATVLGGEIYAAGGQWGHDNSVTQDLDDVHAYDPSSDSWRTVTPLPYPRSHFESSIFTAYGHIAILGGRNNVWGRSTLADVTTYSPATATWTQRTPLPISLIAPSAKKVRETIIVTGGGTRPTEPITQTFIHDLRLQAGQGPARLNAGGEYHRSANGESYCGDQFALNGGLFENTVIQDVLGTEDDALYLTERQQSGPSLDYRVPVENGTHNVRLHFAEIYWGVPGGGSGDVGKRIFDVQLEGETVLAGFDIAADVGVQTAVVKGFQVDVQDGALDIRLQAIIDRAKVSAIEVIRKTADH